MCNSHALYNTLEYTDVDVNMDVTQDDLDIHCSGDRMRKTQIRIKTTSIIDPDEIISKERFILNENERKRVKTEWGYIAVF